MKTINSFQQAHDLDKTHQVTAQELLNGRTYISPEGWQNIELTDNFKMQLCNCLSKLYGGRKATKKAIYRHLMNERRQHWGLSRTVIKDYGKGARLVYITGQDQTFEYNAIRTALK